MINYIFIYVYDIKIVLVTGITRYVIFDRNVYTFHPNF